MRMWTRRKDLMLAGVLCLLSDECAARTESEARAQCIAGCLMDFKAQVSGRLLASLQRQPESINAECSTSLKQISEVQDLNATKRCQTCSHTCNHFGTKKFESHESCQAFCQAQRQVLPSSLWSACQTSCQKVRRLLETNQGECPAPASLGTAGGADCDQPVPRRQCQPDRERQLCYSGLQPMKCCAAECADARLQQFVCVPANVSLELLPEVPPAPTVARLRVSSGTSSVWASWEPYRHHRHSHQPVVFLIQYRSYQGHEFREVSLAASRWQSFAVTTRTGMRVVDSAPGRWYQFRLAAVSSAGHRGYSEPSAPVKPGGEPRRPGPVRRLAQGVSRLRRAEAVVDVRITWEKPEQSDLQVDKYKIKWTETIGVSGHTSLTNFETHVPWTQTEFTLPDLKLDTTYLVKVWAIAHYDELIQLSSKEASIYVATMRLPPVQPGSNTGQINDSRQPAGLQCSCLKPPVTPISIGTAFWEAGYLRLQLRWPNSTADPRRPAYFDSHTVKWTQRVCIESTVSEPTTREAVVHNNPSYTISGLRFNCLYSLQIKGLTSTGHPAVTWDTCFCTRGCWQTSVRGNSVPQCPQDEEPQPPRSVQVSVLRWQPSGREAQPQHQYQYQREQQSQQQQPQPQQFYAARVTWKTPNSPVADAVRGYRIVWAPRVFEDVSPDVYGSDSGLLPRMDASELDTRVLDGGRRDCLLPNLRPGLLYIVRLQAITDFGESRPRTLRFLTPQLGAQPVDSPAWQRRDGENSVQKYIYLAAGADAPTPGGLRLIALSLCAYHLAAGLPLVRLP